MHHEFLAENQISIHNTISQNDQMILVQYTENINKRLALPCIAYATSQTIVSCQHKTRLHHVTNVDVTCTNDLLYIDETNVPILTGKSQGKVRELWADWKSQGNLPKMLAKGFRQFLLFLWFGILTIIFFLGFLKGQLE